MLKTLVCKCCKQKFQTKRRISLGFCRECSTTLKDYTCSVCGKDFKTKPKLVFQKGKSVCKLCVCKANCKAKYGVESPMQLPEIASKSAASRRANFDSESFKEKSRATKIKNYGSLENEKLATLLKRKETNLKKYGVEFPQQLESVKEKQKQTFEAKFGEDWKKKMFSKSRETCKGRYGFENVFSSPVFQEKIKQTNLKKYGVPNPRQNKDVVSKTKATNELKYGGTGFGAPSLRDKYKRKYEYDNLIFDSQWELAFYIYHRDLNSNIQKEPCFFEYTFNGETYKYYPDFRVNGELVEIKGGQFIAENGNWQNPYDHSQDGKYEAKHQCALAHNVKIVTDMKKYLKYVESKYTSDYLKLFDTALSINAKGLCRT